MLSHSEENYLKTIYHLSEKESPVSTNAIAEALNTKPASVTDMIKKLNTKGFINYQKYKGTTLTSTGNKEALLIIRKHRLWEVFLLEKLNFNWDEVHEVAEQLEHIKSKLMIERLDEFLGFPQHDPHGDPIPNKNGEFDVLEAIKLTNIECKKKVVVVAVQDSNSSLLQYLDKMGIGIGSKLYITEKIEFDQSLEITINDRDKKIISALVSENILVKED
ncbi:FeoA domain-containing protein [Flammeovirga yaeyamensis]|uniref:Transcriptional regulator MntR n=1 Tax=Flammeovirga yaeyamensis TaxID=367791 RepID=A0AAX1N260_9BACT|nr:metal-dependent transcriptional regulator [Flammeovirga yaeyamensis]MBB3696355.1 DtxR family Mn-dependent transcriptional regulator [Flammeovirga yaeyamensis]NMF35034.1 metal-dependent transcriptional regulator [Flammeovirga yaeyamensis]QWG00142.1 FeoA domain-containing protein [Flammeovirga yaeyamensis]